MNSIPTGRDWVPEAQKLILSLRDIARVSITLSEDDAEIEEINILAEGRRPPKQIVRDVRSALRAEYQIDLDYRKVSVAQKRAGGEGDPEPAPGPVLHLPESRIYEESIYTRLRFESVAVNIDQNECRARVELSIGPRAAVGEAQGVSTVGQVNRLVARATVDAIGKFLDDRYTLNLVSVDVVDLEGQEVILVAVRFGKDRNEKTLTGSCPARHDLQQAVVYATLSTVNRLFGRLRQREPVEYEIRPTSMT